MKVSKVSIVNIVSNIKNIKKNLVLVFNIIQQKF